MLPIVRQEFDRSKESERVSWFVTPRCAGGGAGEFLIARSAYHAWTPARHEMDGGVNAGPDLHRQLAQEPLRLRRYRCAAHPACALCALTKNELCFVIGGHTCPPDWAQPQVDR